MAMSAASVSRTVMPACTMCYSLSRLPSFPTRPYKPQSAVAVISRTAIIWQPMHENPFDCLVSPNATRSRGCAILSSACGLSLPHTLRHCFLRQNVRRTDRVHSMRASPIGRNGCGFRSNITAPWASSSEAWRTWNRRSARAWRRPDRPRRQKDLRRVEREHANRAFLTVMDIWLPGGLGASVSPKAALPLWPRARRVHRLARLCACDPCLAYVFWTAIRRPHARRWERIAGSARSVR